LRKKIENRFSELYPDKWIPLYSQVTFSHIPYSKALATGKKQEKIMEKIMAMPDIEKTWNNAEVYESILKYLD
jgi:kynurenine 3-monooxygenase